MLIKNSNDTIGNQTRDLAACSAVPQPSALHGTIALQEIPADFTITTYLLITDPTRFGVLFFNAVNSEYKSLQSMTE